MRGGVGEKGGNNLLRRPAEDKEGGRKGKVLRGVAHKSGFDFGTKKMTRRGREDPGGVCTSRYEHVILGLPSPGKVDETNGERK